MKQEVGALNIYQNRKQGHTNKSRKQRHTRQKMGKVGARARERGKQQQQTKREAVVDWRRFRRF